MKNCKICGAEIDPACNLVAKENMFGTHVEFVYNHCLNCSSIQINETPENLKDYYANSYYTYTKEWETVSKLKTLVYNIKRSLARTILYNLLHVIKSQQIIEIVHFANLKRNSAILDVGCGNGDLLYDFSKYGFTNMTGIDPFLKKEFRSTNLNLYRSDIFQYSTPSDLIIFNHTFEHMEKQYETLLKTRELLAKNGTLLISTPILNYAFEKYKESWAQLDAPRHLTIHSEKSLSILCKKAGFEIYKIIYDSDEFQFMASEQYCKNISLHSPKSYLQNFSQSIFTQKDLNKYRQLSKKLNKEKLGDQAAFYIRRIKI